MRSAILVAPFVALVACSKDTTSKSYTLVPELSGSVTVTSTYRYSNPATAYLTETNSAGVVTGEPGASAAKHTQPAAVTSQPELQTIPAGLSGTTVIYINATSGLTSFTVSANKKTTKILGHPGGKATGSSNPFSSNGASPTGGHGHHKGKPGSSASGKGNSGSGSSSSSSSTGGAAPTGMKVAGAGVIGLGAFVAALL